MFCLYLQGRRALTDVYEISDERAAPTSSALNMVATRFSETSVNIYKATRRKVSGDSNFHCQRHENLTSHIAKTF
jgi:hypothetical protein